MPFCTRCGSRVTGLDSFCGTCGWRRLSLSDPSPSAAATATVEQAEKNNLGKEHNELLVRLGLVGGLLTIVLSVAILVVADSVGKTLGGIIVGAAALLSVTLLAASFVAEFGDALNDRLTSQSRIDPLTGAPLRMVWWCRWFAGTLAVFMLMALPDYSRVPQQPATVGVSDGDSNLTPQLSEADRDYIAAVRQQADDLSHSMARWSELMRLPQLDNQDWRIEVAAQLATWKTTYQNALALRPPPRFEALNAEYLSALEKISAAADGYTQGLDDIDPDEINQANDELRSAAQDAGQLASQVGEAQPGQ